jgi:hypothetical protein
MQKGSKKGKKEQKRQKSGLFAFFVLLAFFASPLSVCLKICKSDEQ